MVVYSVNHISYQYTVNIIDQFPITLHRGAKSNTLAKKDILKGQTILRIRPGVN